MITKPFIDHFKFATDLTIIAKGNVSEIGPCMFEGTNCIPVFPRNFCSKIQENCRYYHAELVFEKFTLSPKTILLKLNEEQSGE